MPSPNGRHWRCLVCGYVHQGDAPPEWCPICGAAAAEFEEFEPVSPPEPAKVEQWKCLNCNYVHAGSEAPEMCPVCAAAKDRFEPMTRETAASGTGRKVKVVVVGAGIAGVSAVESMRQASPDAEIILVSKEEDLPYYRLNLTRYLAGEVGEEGLPIHPVSWYEEQKVELKRGAEISELSLDAKEVKLRGEEKIPFEKLIFTVGAHPFIPPFPGTVREGVFSLRTKEDADRILAMEKGRCVCIGGGILGLEAAGALARQGMEVTLLESHEWLMPRQLNRAAGKRLEAFVEGLGIRLRLCSRTDEIVGDERVKGVKLDDGDTMPADVVVITTGVRPNSYLARTAGLEVNRGLIVNNRLLTSHPDVYAAGDVAEHRGVLYGNWSASQYQGGIAGMNAVGGDAEFGGIPRSNMLKVLGLDMLSIGRFEPEDGSYQVIEGGNGAYARFVFRDGCMVGAVLLGDTSLSGGIKKAVESRKEFSGLLRKKPTVEEVQAEC